MDDQVRELVALGKEHFQRGDYSLAAGHLEQVVARGAAFADVHMTIFFVQVGHTTWAIVGVSLSDPGDLFDQIADTFKVAS